MQFLTRLKSGGHHGWHLVTPEPALQGCAHIDVTHGVAKAEERDSGEGSWLHGGMLWEGLFAQLGEQDKAGVPRCAGPFLLLSWFPTPALHLILLLPDVQIHAQAHACHRPAWKLVPGAAGFRA